MLKHLKFILLAILISYNSLAQTEKIESVFVALVSSESNRLYFEELQNRLKDSFKDDYNIDPEFYVIEIPDIYIDSTIMDSQERRRAFKEEVKKQTYEIDRDISKSVNNSSASHLMIIKQIRQTNYFGGFINGGLAAEFQVLLFEKESGRRILTYEYDHHHFKLKGMAKISSRYIIKHLKQNKLLESK